MVQLYYNEGMSLRTKALLAILTAAILWGAAGTVAKLLLAQANPFVITGYRFGAATLIMLPFFITAKKPKRWFISLLPLGLFNAANVLLYYSGLSLTTANTSALLGAGVPLTTAIIARLLIREPLSRIKLTGITVGLMGALLIVLVPVLEKGQAIGTNITGNLLLVGSIIAWTLYIVRSRSSLVNGIYTPVVSTFVNFATCTIAAFGAAILTHQSLSIPAFKQLPYVGIFLYAVLGLTITTFFLFQWAVQHVSATTASLKEYIQLVEGVALNTLILGERITPIFLLGSILVVFGVVISTSQHVSKKLTALIESRNP